jgi:hypothetical protein
MKLAKRNELRIRTAWPLMLTHRALTGDRKQYGLWRERLERVLQSHRLAKARSSTLRRVIAHTPAWRRARGFGRIGTFVVLGIGSFVAFKFSFLYSQFLNFGVWPWLLFVPPLVPAGIMAKRALENAALGSMAATGGHDEGARSRSAAVSGVLRSFWAGFVGGYSLLFLQGLLSWFLTPAPTLAQELLLDATFALPYGVLFGMFTAPLGLLLGRKPLDPKSLPAAPSAAALLTE